MIKLSNTLRRDNILEWYVIMIHLARLRFVSFAVICNLIMLVTGMDLSSKDWVGGV